MAGASASAAVSGGPRRTSKRPETVCTVVVEPPAAASSTTSPVAVAAALQMRLGGGKGVPFPPPDPPRASVLVLFPWRRRRARLPDGVRPLNAASSTSLVRNENNMWSGSGNYIQKMNDSIHHNSQEFEFTCAAALSPGTCARVASLRCRLP